MRMRSSVNYCKLEAENGFWDKYQNLILAKKVAEENLSYFETLIKKNDSSYYLDWDEMKIYGYFYKPFCEFVNILQQLGLRGTVNLDFEDGMTYEIRFKNDVKCVCYTTPEYNDDGEIVNEHEIDKIVDTFIIHKEGL